MASQYLKRKMKEKAQAESEAAELEKTKVVLDKKAVDVVDIGNGQFAFVLINYNIETGDAEVSFSKPVSRAVGLSFDVKKQALLSLNKVSKE